MRKRRRTSADMSSVSVDPESFGSVHCWLKRSLSRLELRGSEAPVSVDGRDSVPFSMRGRFRLPRSELVDWEVAVSTVSALCFLEADVD
jgi:hypothetical protein